MSQKGLIFEPITITAGCLADPISRLSNALSRRYRIERELGRGGMGDVYLALDLKHQRRVAIKVLPPELAVAMGPERFLREIQIAARLSHPHILPLHDSGQAAGLLYYVMPFVEGESLRDRLRREDRLPVPIAINIAGEIAGALEHAHRLGVIHRDVKPENILIAGGHALLADFGIARPVRMPGDEPITDSGSPIGTAAYMSPEQAAGSSEVDARSDTYSLGCVLYEMMAGSHAAAPLLERRFSEPVPPLHSMRPEVPESLSEAVSQAMALAPGDRFDSIADLAAALEEPSPSAARPRPWMVMGAVLLLVVGGIGLAAALTHRSASPGAKRVLIGEFINRTGSSDLASLGDIATDYIARGLAATRLLDEVFDVRAEPAELAGGEEGVGGVRTMARALGAGTAVWGSYYRLGDSVHFEAHIIEVSSGKVLLSLQPVAGTTSAPTAMVETLRQRVMAGFAAIFGKGFDAWQAQSIPPTFAAYQEMLAGEEAGWQFDFGEALQHYRRAASMDPGYSGARVSSALMLALGGSCPEADSLADLLARNPTPLPPVERGQLDWAAASCRGDMEGNLEAVRSVLRVAPRSVGFSLLASIYATELFHPREAIGLLKALRPIPTEFLGAQEDMYWSFQQLAYHEMGDFARELATARDPRRAHGPDAFGEATALAGLQRTGEVERIAAERLQADPSSWDFGVMGQCLALELHGHSQPQASARLMQQAATWFEAHPPEATDRKDQPPCLWHMLSSAYYAGHWDSVRRDYQAMAIEDTTNAQARFGLGAVAAHRGDSSETARMDHWLELHGRTYDRARLAAIRGDRASAVALIQRAFHEGLNGREYIHADPDLDSLRGYPPYEELVRPKD